MQQFCFLPSAIHTLPVVFIFRANPILLNKLFAHEVETRSVFSKFKSGLRAIKTFAIDAAIIELIELITATWPLRLLIRDPNINGLPLGRKGNSFFHFVFLLS